MDKYYFLKYNKKIVYFLYYCKKFRQPLGISLLENPIGTFGAIPYLCAL